MSRKISSFFAVLLLLVGTLTASAQRGHDNFNRGMRDGGHGGSYENRGGRYDNRNRGGGGIGPGKGALIGAGGGAVLGAVLGGGLKGALVGGAAGAGVGAIAGQAASNNRRNDYRRR